MPGKSVFGPISNDALSVEYRKESLEEVNLIKEKLCGSIKGGTYENGSWQKIYLEGGETVYYPTFLTESLMSTLFIDAKEQSHVAILYVPGDYLHTEMPADKRIFLR